MWHLCPLPRPQLTLGSPIVATVFLPPQMLTTAKLSGINDPRLAPTIAALNETVRRKGGFPSTAVPASVMARLMNTTNAIYEAAFRPKSGGLLKAFDRSG
jgi:hypothetical protein